MWICTVAEKYTSLFLHVYVCVRFDNFMEIDEPMV